MRFFQANGEETMCPKQISFSCIFAMLLLSCALCCSCTLSVPLSFSGSSTSAAADQTLPWEPDLLDIAPTYDVYFSETIDYQTTDWLYSDDPPTDRMNVWPQSEYSVRYYDGTLYLLEATHQSEPIIHLRSSVDLGTDFIFAGCDYQYVYGIARGTDLVRVDYFGQEVEVLFSDPSGKIGTFSESGADYFPGFENRTYRYATQIQMADAKVLFFAAGSTSGDGCSIYRLYLPTGTVDEMVANLPGTFTFLAPVSNHEILWQIENEDFFTRFSEAYSDLDMIYGCDQDERSAMIAFEKDFKVYPYTHFYFNDLTKASVSVPVSSSYNVIASCENEDVCQQTGNYWWRGMKAK